MTIEITKPRKWGWLLAILFFVTACWLAANWEDFKAGYMAGYFAETGSKP